MDAAQQPQRTGRRSERRLAIALAFLLGLVLSWGLRELLRWRSQPAPPPTGAATGETAGAPQRPSQPAAAPSEEPPVMRPVAEAPAGRETLRGVVRLAGRPVAGAQVTASGGAPSVSSDEAGNFTIAGLRPGRYAVRALGTDAAAFLEAVPVPDPQGRPLEIELRPAPALGGHVVDGAGRAVEGAEVTLGEGLVAPLARAVRSDAAGAFRFAAVPSGRYFIAAAAPGYVTAGQPLKVGAAPPEVKLVLGRAAVLAGTVVDDEDHPVVGARVALVRDGASLARSAGGKGAGPAPLLEPAGELGVVRSPIPYPPLDVPWSPPGSADAAGEKAVGGGDPAREKPVGGTISVLGLPQLPPTALSTDREGRFRVGGLPAGRVTVVVSHAAFVDGRSAELELPAGGEASVRVVLRRAIVVRGRVRDGAGAAVAGAELWIDGAFATITDKKGRWELRRLPGAFDVDVRVRGRARSPQHVDPSFRTGVGGEIDLTVGEAESRLTGLVLDTRGLPVGGARVTVEGPGGARQTAVSDAGGEFTVESSPTGPLSIHVAHGDHLRATVAGAQPGDDVRVTLAAGGAVEGEVIDARGGVPAGSRVTIEDAGGERHAGAVDRTGRFRVGGCAPGAATLRAEAPGYLPAQASIDLPTADRSGEVVLRDVRVTLAEAGLLTGTVRDHWGQPAAGVTVEAAGARARTDGAGRFSLTPLPVGPLRVVVTSPDGSQLVESAHVERGRAASLDVRFP